MAFGTVRDRFRNSLLAMNGLPLPGFAGPPRRPGRRFHRHGQLGALVAAVGWMAASAGCDTVERPSQSSPEVPRLGPPERPQDDVVLSDFETDSLAFEFIAGRVRWVGEDDENQGLRIREGGADGSARALEVGPEAATATLSFAELEGPKVLQDLSSCSGFRFWARAPSPAALTVRLHSPGAPGEAKVELTAEWAEITLDWDAFEDTVQTLPGMGGAASGDAGPGGAGGEDSGAVGALRESAVSAIEFTAPDAAEFWLDQVVALGCRLPRLNPPLPKPPALGSAGPEGSPVARHGQLRVEGRTLVDQTGQPVQLKGVSSMWTNWDTRSFAENKAALEFMRDAWGLSVFRVALGVEPSGAYLDKPGPQRRKVERAIANALELGVYLIVDWHAHEALSDPDAAHGFFDEIVAAYGEHPNLIWETFNEPLRVDWSPDLKPYHTSLIETIRRHDPDNLILLGTPQWSQLVDEAAADPLGARNVLYTLHFYACTHDSWLRDAADRALSAGAGLFVSEFGGTHADGGSDQQVCETETRAWLDWMDANDISGVAWRLDNCSDQSTCLLTPSAPGSGGWDDSHLKGHGPLVVEWIRR